MIRATLYDPKLKKVQRGGLELVDAWRESDNQVIWVDIESISNNDDEELLLQFDIHPCYLGCLAIPTSAQN